MRRATALALATGGALAVVAPGALSRGRLQRRDTRMPEPATGPKQDLSGVSETLLIMLYIRAMESQRPDALIKDEKAVELVTRMSYDFDRIRRIPLSEGNKVVAVLRDRECDRYAREFLARHPDAVVVHIGCGLDSRFERVDDDRVEWRGAEDPRRSRNRRRAAAKDYPCPMVAEAFEIEVTSLNSDRRR